jgi:hypothetical protein
VPRAVSTSAAESARSNAAAGAIRLATFRRRLNRGDPAAGVIRPGYLDGHWTKDSWTDQGIRDKVGATHRALPALLRAFLDAGLDFEDFAEGGVPTPTMLAVRARKAGA